MNQAAGLHPTTTAPGSGRHGARLVAQGASRVHAVAMNRRSSVVSRAAGFVSPGGLAGFSRRWLAPLVFLSASVASLRAQMTLTSIYDTSLPSGHAPAIGFTAVGSDIYFFSSKTYYTSSAYNGGLSFTVGDNVWTDFGMTVSPASRVVANPATPNNVYIGGGAGLQNLLYTYQFSPPSQSSVSFQSLSTMPSGLAWAGTSTTCPRSPSPRPAPRSSAPRRSRSPPATAGKPGLLNPPRRRTPRRKRAPISWVLTSIA